MKKNRIMFLVVGVLFVVYAGGGGILLSSETIEKYDLIFIAIFFIFAILLSYLTWNISKDKKEEQKCYVQNLTKSV